MDIYVIFLIKKNVFKSIQYDKVYDIARSQRKKLADLIEKDKIEADILAKKQKELEEAKIKKEKLLNKHLPACVDRAFDLSVINLDCNYPIEKIIDGVTNFSEQLVNNTNRVDNLCILFSGNSGCGKTQFAKYLAAMTKLSLKQVRGSDLLNKYHGETEKLISMLFTSASAQNNILLIDEADSLLIDRASAGNSWEITQVNEFLCRMEEFKGILICSSNLINKFDKAAMRRFIFKIKFNGLTDIGKEVLVKKYLNEVCILPEDLSEIKKIYDLRPGDFKAVRDRLLIVYKNKVSYEEALNELKLETSYRQNENLVATI